MSAPTVSIVLPVRNGEQFLAAAIKSLQRQTFTDWELLAIDDGSIDATPDILSASAQSDSRFRILQTGGAGLVTALNNGLAECRGEYIARMDADDICHPRRLELQVAFLSKQTKPTLVACSFLHFPRHVIREGMLGYERWQNALLNHDEITAELYVESPFVHPSVMLPECVMRGAGGYRDCGWPEDYDLWLRLAAAGIRFARLPEVLFFWRDHGARATRTLPAYSKDAFRACKLDHLKSSFLAGVKEVTIAGAGIEGRAWQRLLAKSDIAVTAWVDVDPRKVGRELHGAKIVSALGAIPEGKMLIAIGNREGRLAAREWGLKRGLREGIDFICVS